MGRSRKSCRGSNWDDFNYNGEPISSGFDKGGESFGNRGGDDSTISFRRIEQEDGESITNIISESSDIGSNKESDRGRGNLCERSDRGREKRKKSRSVKKAIRRVGSKVDSRTSGEKVNYTRKDRKCKFCELGKDNIFLNIKQTFGTTSINHITYLKRVSIFLGDTEIYSSDEFDGVIDEVQTRNWIISNVVQVIGRALNIEVIKG